MPKLVLFDETTKNKVHTIPLEMEPYNGDVTFDVVPKTRALVMQAIEKSKRNPIYRRHKEFVEEFQEERVVAGRPDDAFVQELAKMIVIDWHGVEDSTGKSVPCTDENKIKLFENVEVANYIIKAASELGVQKEDEDRDNLGK